MHHDTLEIDEHPIRPFGAVISPAAEDSFDLDEVVRCEKCISQTQQPIITMTQILRQAKHFRTHSVYTGQPFQQSLKLYPDNSFDSMVTDPPYGISFMNKHWDYDVPSVADFKLLYDKIKSGGHILVACGTRTQHRMAVNIEDAGFEIRDIISWVYGSGFPKSLDISKAIDKTNAEPNRPLKFTQFMRSTGLKSSDINRITDTQMGGHYLTNKSQPAIPTPEIWRALKPHCGDVPEWVDELILRIAAKREVTGSKISGISNKNEEKRHTIGASKSVTADITAPATEDAKKWAGWGTALKPAVELWTLARKPLSENTVAANVLQHGTGGLNIDGCRVETDEITGWQGKAGFKQWGSDLAKDQAARGTTGRFPANIIHDGSDAVLALFPETKSGKMKQRIEGGTFNTYGKQYPRDVETIGDSGSAARFFYCAPFTEADIAPLYYCAKASKAERAESKHPTIKPISLMRYLCRLITPPGGTVLDPFAGSGTTAEAALLEGFSVVAMERDAHNLPDIQYRISRALTGSAVDKREAVDKGGSADKREAVDNA